MRFLNIILTLMLFLILCQPITAQIPILSKNITQEDIAHKRSNYLHYQNELEIFRQQQLKRYETASTQSKKLILSNVKKRLESDLITNFFPAWYGTPWDFNGTSQTPGKGKIACGYFVSTNLVHIGFKAPRIRLAQQPSQKIIRTFMDRSHMDISSKRSLPNIKKKLMLSGDGIYITGLDTHVGFIVVSNETITFIHSTYYRPNKQVVAELYDSKNPFSDSKYRVIGKLFHDDMLIHWLYQKHYTVAR